MPPRGVAKWVPVTLDEVQFVVLSMLCAGARASTLDPSFLQYLDSCGY